MTVLKSFTAVGVAAVITVAGALSARADTSDTQSITSAADWIAATWNTSPDRFFAAGTIADGVLALSAANQHPVEAKSMLVKLAKDAPLYVEDNPAGLAKIIMTADAAGQDARHFLGCNRDLVSELKGYVDRNDPRITQYWAPHLITIALARLGEPVPQSVITTLHNTQGADGGFGYVSGTHVSDPDYTGIGLSAMRLLSDKGTTAAIQEQARASISSAILWSEAPANRRTDGAGNYYWMTYSPANSTGILAGGLAELGQDVASPARFLKAQQALTGAGAWASSLNGTTGDVMATTQAIFGVAGKSYATIRSTQVAPLLNCNTPTPTPTSTPTPTPSPSPSPTYSFKPSRPYTLPGTYEHNGRRWSTTCQPYSQTQRCRTEIWATQVKQVNGRWTLVNGWTFNNLTYLPSHRALWKNNPLGKTGSWTTPAGRKWQTECDTAKTGRGACRSYLWTTYMAASTSASGARVFTSKTGWVFNNIVMFIPGTTY